MWGLGPAVGSANQLAYLLFLPNQHVLPDDFMKTILSQILVIDVKWPLSLLTNLVHLLAMCV